MSHLHIGKKISDNFTQCNLQMEVRLETVESEKDLGVIIDSAFSFRENISSNLNC